MTHSLAFFILLASEFAALLIDENDEQEISTNLVTDHSSDTQRFDRSNALVHPPIRSLRWGAFIAGVNR